MTSYMCCGNIMSPETRKEALGTLGGGMNGFGHLTYASGIVWLVASVAWAIFTDLFSPVAVTAGFFASIASIAGPITLIAGIACILFAIPYVVLSLKNKNRQ